MKKATIAKLLVVCLIASMLCIPAGAAAAESKVIDWGENKTHELNENTDLGTYTISADTTATNSAYTIKAGAHTLSADKLTVEAGASLNVTYKVGTDAEPRLFYVKGAAEITSLSASSSEFTATVKLTGEGAEFICPADKVASVEGGYKDTTYNVSGYDKFVFGTEPDDGGDDDNGGDNGGNSGGSTGGGTTTPTEPKDTEVAVKPTVDADKGTASATVSNTQANKMVNDAAKNKSENVIVKVDVPEGVDVTEVSATIPASAVKGLAEKTDANLIVETPLASITLPNAALEALGAASGTVTVTATKVDDNTVKIAVAKNNDEPMTSISGGLTAVVPVENTTTGTVAFIVDAEGNKTLIKKSVANADGAMVVPLDGSATITFADNSKDFNDMGSTAWAQEAVNFVSSRELFKGTSDTSFGPTVIMDRAMLVTVLYRLEDASADGTPAFGDVNSGEWYTDAVAWASSNEIVQGLGDGSFGPDAPVSREQIAVFLYRYANVIGIDTTGRGSLDGFDDAAATNSWAQDAMQWAVSINLFQGDEGTSSLRPGDSASRAEVATLLMRFVQYIAG